MLAVQLQDNVAACCGLPWWMRSGVRVVVWRVLLCCVHISLHCFVLQHQHDGRLFHNNTE